MKISEIKKLYGSKDKMHDWNHIRRIKKNAELLKKGEKADEELLNFLINFHGLKDYVLLHKNEFEKNKVQSLIRSHKNPKLIEEKIVFDANTLDNLGVQGMKKALYVGRLKGRNKEDTFDYLRESLKRIKFYTKKGKEIGEREMKLMEEKLK